MKFENTEVWGFEHALRGMRNPMNSWDKSDSHIGNIGDFLVNVNNLGEKAIIPTYIIGNNDIKLAQSLIRGGSEHRKFMRQIFVSVDITAPLYWWKEQDVYKIGTVANSTSTMHKLASTPITLDCFEIDDFDLDSSFCYSEDCNIVKGMAEYIIRHLEFLRQRYLDTKDKKYWKELIRWLPEGWLQRRTITMSYENLLCMCSKGQRRNHKLNEWSGVDNPELPNFISWARSLPYAAELIFFDEGETK